MRIITQIALQRLAIIIFMGFNLSFNSCNKCWECTYEAEIITPTDTIIETIEEKTCLQEEYNNFQIEGYECTSQ